MLNWLTSSKKIYILLSKANLYKYISIYFGTLILQHRVRVSAVMSDRSI